MMSANITAASTPWRRTGCSVTSAQSSGVCATSQKECRSRIARYSGRERPAWRMNQTGVRSTGSSRAARTRSGSTAVRLASRVEGTSRRPLGRAAPGGVAGGHDRDRERRGDERRLAAVGRPGLPRLALARRPRQPDRLGRAAQRGAPARAGRERVASRRRSACPIPPGRYRLAFDMVAELRAWFSELGSPMLADGRRGRPARRASRTRRCPRASSRRRTGQSASAPRTPRVSASSPVRSSGRRRFGRPPRALAPYAPGPGRVPGFSSPLLCPSVLPGIELEPLGEVAGLPAFAAPQDEPWIYDGRIVLARRELELDRDPVVDAAEDERAEQRARAPRRPSGRRRPRAAAGCPTRARRAPRRSAARPGCPSAARRGARVLLRLLRQRRDRPEHRRQEEPGQERRGRGCARRRGRARSRRRRASASPATSAAKSTASGITVHTVAARLRHEDEREDDQDPDHDDERHRLRRDHRERDELAREPHLLDQLARCRSSSAPPSAARPRRRASRRDPRAGRSGSAGSTCSGRAARRRPGRRRAGRAGSAATTRRRGSSPCTSPGSPAGRGWRRARGTAARSA